LFVVAEKIVKIYCPTAPNPSPFSFYFDRFDASAALQYKSINFAAVPGVLHSEIHIFPEVLSVVLSVISKEDDNYKIFSSMFDRNEKHLESGKITTAYQGYFELLLLSWQHIIPTIEQHVSQFFLFKT
jgi:hypothetical protein